MASFPVHFRCGVAALAACLLTAPVRAEEYYVSPQGWHTNSGRSLEQAWQTIPYAMTRVNNGDTIWVDAGVYELGADGGYPPGAQLPARWAIYKPVVVQSLYGAAQTVVVGQPHSADSALGEFAIRGVYLASNAMLIGVTVSNGHTRMESTHPTDMIGGGIYAESDAAGVYDCVIRNCSAYSMAGGAYQGAYHRTQFIRNAVPFGLLDGGGGVALARLFDCQVVSNEFYGNLIFFSGYGGGAYKSSLFNCLVADNRVVSGCGGGLYDCRAYNCIIRGNQATMWNEQDSNRSRGCGGGAREGELYNCTVVANYAQKYGGGADRCSNIVNSILVSNVAGWAFANHVECYSAYSCSQPAPTGGVANLDASPGFVDYAAGNLRLASGSPCRDAGLWQSWMSGWPWDVEGAARIMGAAPDLGAYESATAAAFHLTAISLVPGVGAVVGWQSESGYQYRLRRSVDPTMGFTEIMSAIPGAAGFTIVTDTTAGVASPFFYCVGRSP